MLTRLMSVTSFSLLITGGAAWAQALPVASGPGAPVQGTAQPVVSTGARIEHATGARTYR